MPYEIPPCIALDELETVLDELLLNATELLLTATLEELDAATELLLCTTELLLIATLDELGIADELLLTATLDELTPPLLLDSNANPDDEDNDVELGICAKIFSGDSISVVQENV